MRRIAWQAFHKRQIVEQGAAEPMQGQRVGIEEEPKKITRKTYAMCMYNPKQIDICQGVSLLKKYKIKRL